MAERILVLAPLGRDAQVMSQVLCPGGTVCKTCPDIEHLCSSLDDDASGIIVTEEVLFRDDVTPLLKWCEHQPPWSDLPIIVLSKKHLGPRSPRSSEVLERLGNVVLIERPINAETLISAVRSITRERRRQYQARGLLKDLETTASQLRAFNAMLEERVADRTRELDSARETLAFALDSAGMGSWDLDLEAGSARRSLKHDQLFGYRNVLPTWDVQQFLSHVVPEDRARVAKVFDAAVLADGVDFECRILRADGETRWITAKGKVKRDKAGALRRMAGVIMDTTERKRTEESLHQAQKMEAIGQLTGGVAHDFNNLLTVIVGGLDMMIRRPDQPDRVVRLAEAAMTAARRGEKLTQQLLAFSRRQMLRPETLNPNRLLLDFERPGADGRSAKRSR